MIVKLLEVKLQREMFSVFYWFLKNENPLFQTLLAGLTMYMH